MITVAFIFTLDNLPKIFCILIHNFHKIHIMSDNNIHSFSDVAFTYILFFVNCFRLHFFTGIIVDKHRVKIVPQTIEKIIF